jgi:hypothetical protein
MALSILTSIRATHLNWERCLSWCVYIPLLISLVASYIAWYAELEDMSYLNSYSSYLVIFTGLIIVLIGRWKLPMPIAVIILTMMGIIGSIVVFNILTGRSATGSGGLYGLIATTIIMTLIYSESRCKVTEKPLLDSINFVYSIHLIYILIETVIILTGNIYFLQDLIPVYRILPGQPIYLMLGISSPGSPNGMYVGAQVASQMLALNIAWHMPVFRYPTRLSHNQTVPWQFYLSLILFQFSMTNTALLMLVAMSLAKIYLFPIGLYKPWVIKYRNFICIGVLLLLICYDKFDLLFYRFTNIKAVQIYNDAFLDPINVIFQLPLYNKLFGMQADKYLLNYADFGWAVLALNNGLIVTFSVVLFIFFVLLMSIYKLYRTCNVIDDNFKGISYVLANSIVQIIGWSISLSHYYVAIEHGGKEIFSMIIAITIVSVALLSEQKCTAPKINNTNDSVKV